jgi:hypothetical protein
LNPTVIAFLDASALIYRIEGSAPLAGKTRRLLVRLQAECGGLRTAVSRLTFPIFIATLCVWHSIRNSEVCLFAQTA